MIKKVVAYLILTGLIMLPLAFAGEKGEHGEDAGKLIGMEKRLWKGWSENDPAPFEKLLRGDSRFVGPWGTKDKAKMVASVKQASCDVRGYSVGDVHVAAMSQGAVLLSYTAEQDATCDGEQVASPIIVSSVWIRHGGTWQSVLYHETPLAAEER
ncbi:MAG: nuclear transport factor 2 family protein [Acidobacteriota bacterium]|nr:nuclear transport factor 2 family protein [Acidobacteriota bacterium]